MNFKHFRNLRLAPALSYHPQRFFLLNRRERELRVAPSAFRPGARNAQLRAFLDHLALKLRETR